MPSGPTATHQCVQRHGHGVPQSSINGGSAIELRRKTTGREALYRESIMQRLFILSLIVIGTAANGQETTPLFEAKTLTEATPEPDTKSSTAETESPESAKENIWKPKLLIRLQTSAKDQLPLAVQGSPTAVSEIADVYCDNISVNITSPDDGPSQYTLNCESAAHVRTLGLQIDCDTLEISDGQLTMTNVRIVQQGQTITTEKLSMTLPVISGASTAKFNQPLNVLDATPGNERRIFEGSSGGNSDWNPQPRPFARSFSADDEPLRRFSE